MRSRESILEATREAIGEAGFDGVFIAAVAKRAEVSRQLAPPTESLVASPTNSAR